MSNEDVIDWIYNGNKIKVKNGNFNIPTSLLAGSAIVRREQTQYFDFDPNYWVTKDPSYNSTTPSLEAKTIRQQLSLNTCVGCHAGETKTRFTQINALAYGESANYWSATIDGATGIPQDIAFYPWGGTDPLQLGGMNNGETNDDILGSVINFDVQTEINHHDFFQHISAFLTGRRFTSFDDPMNGSDTWQDDETDDANNFLGNIEFADNSMVGYFYVNDPSNNILTDQFPYLHDQKWGYNDLLRRKNLLCLFLNSSCNGTGSELEFTALNLMANLSFVPLPLGAH